MTPPEPADLRRGSLETDDPRPGRLSLPLGAVGALFVVALVVSFLAGRCGGPDEDVLDAIDRAVDSTAAAAAGEIRAARDTVRGLRGDLEAHERADADALAGRLALEDTLRRLRARRPVAPLPPDSEPEPVTPIDTLERIVRLQDRKIAALEVDTATLRSDRRRTIAALRSLEDRLDSLASANRRLDSLAHRATAEGRKSRLLLGFLPPPCVFAGAGGAMTPSGRVYGGATVGVGWCLPLEIGPWKRK